MVDASVGCAAPLPPPGVVVALPFVGTLLDIGGMWLTRFVWPPLAVLVIAGGTLFAVGYVVNAGISLYEMWVRKAA